MLQKDVTNILTVIGIVILAGIAGFFLMSWPIDLPVPSPSPAPTPILPPRPGPTPVPTPTPSPSSKLLECTSDAQCPSSKYTCEGIIGEGYGYPGEGASQEFTIIKGVCKLKEGRMCRVDTDCAGGLLCHRGACANPIGRDCAGPSDTSCPADYQCVQKCGPPVPMEGDTSLPGYSCQLKGYRRNCPICLAENTLIDTPAGAVPVQNLQKGMRVWTIDALGNRIAADVLNVSRTRVPAMHEVAHIVLEDGRKLFVSAGHPTSDGRTIGALKQGDLLDKSNIVKMGYIPYRKGFTYDILPSGGTGFYWANGILIGSTLK